MIKVLRVGKPRDVVNPVDGRVTNMIPVTFIEEGRSSANAELAESSDALSKALGIEVGLPTVRTHTQNVPSAVANNFAIDKEINALFINRTLLSLPAMRQQENVASRLIDGKPTYFVTAISDKQEADKDLRMSNETLANLAPELFKNARTSVAEVRELQAA